MHIIKVNMQHFFLYFVCLVSRCIKIMALFDKISNKRISYEEEIYEECHKRLFYTSMRIINNSYDAEEVMHDTLLKLFSRKEKFNSDNERNAWLTRVCINMSIDRLRRKSVETKWIYEENKQNQDNLKFEPEIEEYSFKGVTVKMIKDALVKLAEGYRVILSLVLFEGYDYEEIAQITNLKEVTVRTQYIRGKARLIEEIEKIRQLG